MLWDRVIALEEEVKNLKDKYESKDTDSVKPVTVTTSGDLQATKVASSKTAT